jgi:signal transduction histidine kinase/AraC-like DNA-binding protein/CheY-like chemotaxis protein/ABC-type xylose transport system substrate-binding protein
LYKIVTAIYKIVPKGRLAERCRILKETGLQELKQFLLMRLKKITQLAIMFALPLIKKRFLEVYQFKRIVRFLLKLGLLLFVVSCSSPQQQDKKIKIGFSQCQGGDDWRKTMLAEMKRELSFHENVEFIYRDAEADSKKQLKQIEELATLNIDLLIVSPNEIQPLSSGIEKIFDSGIPVVLVDRGINSKKYTAFIGASNFEVGQNAGRYSVSILKGKGNVIEVMGLSDASPFIDRHRGFMDIISQEPGINYLRKFDDHAVNYKKDLANTLLTEKNIDLIFAQTDYIALDVYKICKQTGVDKKIKIIGVDGLPSDTLGMGMVANKFLAATVLYPTGGQEAIITAMKILEHQPYIKENLLATSIIDSANVRIMKLQYDKVLTQQEDIDKRQKKIEEQIVITRNKSNIIVAISIILAFSLIMGVVLFYYLRENRKINMRLVKQNEEIVNQRNQLIELGKKAKEATDAKFNFFTNISHELRTPLTLILGPLEEIVTSPKLHFTVKTQLEMVKKNAMRLLRLVNQLMDFRKIEEAKMKLRASENNITEFVTEITNAFTEIATKKKISFRIDSKDTALKVWFDVNMLDKILFNILSNAFKYTNDHGSITVFVDKDNTNAIIKIEDSGIGMGPETLEHAFDLFYQGNEGTYKGTGLGLALSKELITLHHGSIKVKSEKWKGATFEINLPLGKEHLEESETERETAPYFLNYEDSKIYTNEAEVLKFVSPEDTASTTAKDYSILLIEDNMEIRLFLKSQLGKNYEIIEAENGNVGLNQAYEIVPDIIISDILLPGKDGMLITETLKNDIRTSHIPIIILTAKGSIEQQIEGLKLKADAYIVKPFNIQYLEETVKNLIRNRETLKDHYSSELPNESLRASASKKLDRKFVNEFSSIVEGNIANENFGVDDICKEIGISRVQLYRKVKAVLGLNINDYILSVRMQRAKYLLVNEDLSISEISFKVGFSSQAYFSTVFKSKFGFTPSEFKTKK